MLLSISILWTLKWAEYVFNMLAYIGVFLGQICILGNRVFHNFYLKKYNFLGTLGNH